MKTVSVRIGKDQAIRLHEIVDRIPGGSINGVVQRAVEQWLEIEGPVYLAAFREAQGKLAQTKKAIQGQRRTVKRDSRA